MFSATANGFGRAFYQPNEFTVFQDSYAFEFIDKSINISKIHYFITTSLNKIYSQYDWGNKSGWNKIKGRYIKLPTKNGEIDFEFIESFVAELEARHVAELEAYLTITGLENYELTEKEEEVINKFFNLNWRTENVINIFSIKNTKSILSQSIKINSGKTPYLCASSENNGVSTYISYEEDLLDKGNCIFIGGKTFVVSYQKEDFYSNDSHNLALYLKENEITKNNSLYLATCLKKGLEHKYSWGNSVSKSKIQKDKMLIPIKDNEIDFEFMELFISAIQKLVIKDVAIYAKKKKEATQEVINREII